MKSDVYNDSVLRKFILVLFAGFLVCASQPAHAVLEYAPAIVVGNPSGLGVRLILMDDRTNWGGQFEFGHTGSPGDSVDPGYNTYRIEGRYHIYLGEVATYGFGGLALQSGRMTAGGKANDFLPLVHAGIGFEGRTNVTPHFAPGFGVEFAPMLAFTSTPEMAKEIGVLKFVLNFYFSFWFR